MLRVLGLDLGEHLGWSICEFADKKWAWIEFGCKDLKSSAREVVEDAALRFRMWEFVALKASALKITHVAIEDVNPATMRGNRQRILHYGYRAIAELCAAQIGVKIIYVPVGTIKKRVTGNGSATKESMVVAIRKAGVNTLNDNTADACGVALAAIDKIRIEALAATRGNISNDHRTRSKGRSRKVNSRRRTDQAARLRAPAVRRPPQDDALDARCSEVVPVGDAGGKGCTAAEVRRGIGSADGPAPWH
jgi:Holliday junction resolvasome RuvABC endonuclease subunit